MDEAKVIINLKEGIIELQGPVDFVRHYLDRYQHAMKDLESLPKESKAASPEKTRVVPRKIKVAPRKKAEKGIRAAYTGTIRSDLEAGFFGESRSTNEVKRRLTEAGLTFTDSGVRASLRRLSIDGALDIVREGRAVRYQRRVQA